MKQCCSVALALPLLLTLACVEDTPHPESSPKSKPEQELTITYGGFIQNGPQDQLLDGQCRTNLTRDRLQCDIHNGFMRWNITEITFQVIRGRDPENEHHYFRERASIASLQTATITMKLGMQLPADTYWSWLIVGAKGQPVE